MKKSAGLIAILSLALAVFRCASQPSDLRSEKPPTDPLPGSQGSPAQTEAQPKNAATQYTPGLPSPAFLEAVKTWPLSQKPTSSPDWKALSAGAAEEIILQSGHELDLTSFAGSIDGKIFVSASEDKSVRVWDYNGNLLQILRVRGEVKDVALSPNGRHIAVGTEETLTLFNLERGRYILSKEIKQQALALAFMPDSSRLLIGGTNGFQMVRLPDGTPQDSPLRADQCGQNRGVIARLAISPDGEWVIGRVRLREGDDDSKSRLLLDRMDGTVARCLESSYLLDPLAFSVDSRFFFDFKRNKLLIRDLQGEVAQEIIFIDEKDFKSASAILPDPAGKWVALGLHNNEVRVFDFNRALLTIFNTKQDPAIGAQRVADIALGAGGDSLVVGNANRNITFWNMAGQLQRRLPVGGLDIIHSVDIKKKAGMYAMGQQSQAVRVEDDEAPVQLVSLDGHPILRLNIKGPNMVRLTPDASKLVIGGIQGALVVVDVESAAQKVLWPRRESGGNLIRFDISPDGKTLVACCGYPFLSGGQKWAEEDRGSELTIFDLEGNRKAALQLDRAQRGQPLFLPGSDRILVGSGSSQLTLYNLALEVIKKQSIAPANFQTYQVDLSSGQIVTYNLSNGTIHTLGPDLQPLNTTVAGKPGEYATALAVSPNGKWLAVAFRGKTETAFEEPIRIDIFQRPEIKLVKSIPMESFLIEDLDFSEDSLNLVAAGGSGQIQFWETEGFREASHFIELDEWVLYTPQGLFDATRNGGRLIAVVRGLEAWGMDQFAPRYNRPDLLLGQLGLGSPTQLSHYRHQHEKRLKKLGLNQKEIEREGSLPVAQIAQATRQKDILRLDLLFQDTLQLRTYNIYVNDVPLFGSAGKSLTGREVTLAEEVLLTPGSNKVEVSCSNQRGQESHRQRLLANAEGGPKPNLYFLGFGISRYRDPNLELKYAHKDAQDLADTFKKMEGRSFARVNTKVYLNEAVTREAIAQGKAFISLAHENDLFVLFIAGHGLYSKTDDATYYYLLHDTDISGLTATAIEFEAIEDLLQGIKPRRKLFLMDTCESGEIGSEDEGAYLASAETLAMQSRGIKVAGKVPMGPGKTAVQSYGRTFLYQRDRYIYNDLLRRSGAIVFSSSKGGELSYETDAAGNGLFTEEIIKALTTPGADQNKDGQVGIDELVEVVARGVVGATKNLQHPTVDRDNIFIKFGFPAAISE